MGKQRTRTVIGPLPTYSYKIDPIGNKEVNPMALPRNRHSNARKNSRRAHHAKKPANFAACENCGSARLPHVLCQACGFYAGREVIAGKKED